MTAIEFRAKIAHLHKKITKVGYKSEEAKPLFKAEKKLCELFTEEHGQDKTIKALIDINNCNF